MADEGSCIAGACDSLNLKHAQNTQTSSLEGKTNQELGKSEISSQGQINGLTGEQSSPQNDDKSCHEESFSVVYLADSDLKRFEHQVSGHGTQEKGLLKHKNGYILKPLQAPPLGTREVSFYQRIHENSGEKQEICYESLKPFVPKYYGVASLTSTTTADQHGVSAQTPSRYLLLDDVIEGFKRPCVADVKIGSQTWSPDASESKIKQEMSKYKGTKIPLGMCLTGMQFFDVHTNEQCKTNKDFCKSLDPSTLKTSLEKFFNKNTTGLHCKLVDITIEKVREIEKVFNFQKSFKLYGSSVLVAYDADFFSTDDNLKVVSEDDNEIPLRVFMIDFAHFHPSEDDSVDENYLFGLKNFIKILCDISEPCTQ